MEISKLTFSEETKKQLANPFLNARKKSNLKRELVKDYIRNKPAGHLISTAELIRVAGYELKGRDSHKEYKVGWSFINYMLKKKMLIKEAIPNTHKAIWSIPGDSRVVVPAKPKQIEEDRLEQLIVEDPKSDGAAEKSIQSSSFTDRVEDAAKRFVWYTGSFNVKEFVEWLKN